MNDVCVITKRCSKKLDNGKCGLNIICQPIVEQCVGCGRSEEGYCVPFSVPETKWRINKTCSMATHIKEESVQAAKKRVGQQKQKKH